MYKRQGLEYVETGCVLSGPMKGKPRVPSNVQPNSAVVLTDCGNGGEDDRCIIGIGMAGEHFWGKECEDGRILMHDRYQLKMCIRDSKKSLHRNYLFRIKRSVNGSAV